MLHFKQPNGRYRPATDDELFTEAAQARRRLFAAERRPFSSPADVAPFLRDQLAHLPHEVLLFLDTRHRLLSYERVGADPGAQPSERCR